MTGRELLEQLQSFPFLDEPIYVTDGNDENGNARGYLIDSLLPAADLSINGILVLVGRSTPVLVSAEELVPTKIYVIVEKVPVVEDGDYTVEQSLCDALGFFTEESLSEAEEIVEEKNRAFLKEMCGYSDQQIDEDDVDEEYLNRFSVVLVQGQ